MKSAISLLDRLRLLPRGYKCAVLLLAAWAPLLFPQNPLWAAILMVGASAVFFAVTGPRASQPAIPPTAVRENRDE